METYWRPPLSNFAPLPVRWRGEAWPTSEAVYQAMKFPRFEHDIRQKIRLAPSPYTAKKIAYAHKHLWRPDWLDLRLDAMRWTLKLKTRDNWPTIYRELKASAGRDIVELSQKDLYWGAWWMNGQLVGENWLGKLWMEIREEVVQL